MSCEYCGSAKKTGNYCNAKNFYSNFVCTREKGHTGMHVACSVTSCNLISWGDIFSVKPLSFSEDCGYHSCRAKTNKVNDSFCKRHEAYFKLHDEAYFKLKAKPIFMAKQKKQKFIERFRLIEVE